MTKFDLAQFIDHTQLKPYVGQEALRLLCVQALRYRFACVCVLPQYVKLCAGILRDSSIGVATVVGFPLGSTYTEAKIAESIKAIENGATELDMVMDLTAAIDGSWDQVQNDIEGVVRAAAGVTVKVIIETCYLTKEQISKACQVILATRANFIKTSTGFGSAGAQLEDVALIKSITNGKIGIKAAGGINNRQLALDFITAGATRIGTSSGVFLVEGN